MSGMTSHLMAGYERAQRARACIGLSYGNPATREAYLRHQYPGDVRPVTVAPTQDVTRVGDTYTDPVLTGAVEPTPAAYQMGSSQSGCLLHLRGLLAVEGLDDDITFRGRLVDALEGPYAAQIGMVEGLLQSWCQQRGGGLRRYTSEVMPVFEPGDLVVIGYGLATHGLCVLEQSAEIVTSSDGGQSDPRNEFRPTMIAERVRRLQRLNGIWHLGDRPLVWGWR